jgi:hypothetical protein
MLPQVGNLMLRKDESRKHVEWRLCGRAVSYLSKTSGMHIKSLINIYTTSTYLFSVFLAVCPCFALKKYISTSKFPFRAPGLIQNG